MYSNAWGAYVLDERFDAWFSCAALCIAVKGKWPAQPAINDKILLTATFWQSRQKGQQAQEHCYGRVCNRLRICCLRNQWLVSGSSGTAAASQSEAAGCVVRWDGTPADAVQVGGVPAGFWLFWLVHATVLCVRNGLAERRSAGLVLDRCCQWHG